MALLTVGALSACTAIPVAEREQPVPLPDAFALAADTAATLDVCTALAPPESSAWLERVSAGNFDLRTAAARVRQAEALAAASASPLWPRLDAQVEASRANTPFVPVAFIPRTGIATTWQGSIAASYELDVWARLRHEHAAAELDESAARYSLEALELMLGAQTLDAWFGAVSQRQLLGLLDAQTDTSEKFLELTRLRFGLGQVPAQDIGRQKQQLLSLNGQRTLTAAQSALSDSRLEALAGVVPGTLEVQAQALPPVPPIPDPGVPADIVNRRPDVQAAFASLAAADRRTAVAIAQRLPSVQLSTSLLSIEQTFADLFADAFWSIGATIAGNLFDAGGQRARIELASARAEQALIAYADTLLRATREVHEALIRNTTQDVFAASLDAQAHEARTVLALTRDAYRQGQASYLDVLNALLSLQGLERQIVDAHRQQLANRIDLCRAAGVAPGARIPS